MVSLVVSISIIIIFLFPLLIRTYMRLTTKIYKECVGNMTDKVIIVTGTNSGIGFETAKGLAAQGTRIILACRNQRKGILARDLIISQTGNDAVVFRHLDLSSLASIRKFAAQIMESEDRLDVLVNNAGVYGLGDRYTGDNILEGMQVNHFGPFLLTILLLPLLHRSRPSRIINVSSILHHLGQVDINLLNKKNYYMDLRTYANSKLCNIMFSVELSRRLRGTGVVANAVHPGVIMTSISETSDFKTKVLFAIWCWLSVRTAKDGAQSIIHLAVSEDCAGLSGKYFVDSKEARMRWIASDPELGTDLWKFSEELVQYRFKGL